MATLIKTLTLRLGDEQYECQLNTAEVVDNPTTEDIETFCGKETFATAAYQLHVAGFQDWVDATSICELIDDAYRADPTSELDYEIALGPVGATQKFRSGQCKPINAPAFGGTAGSALTMDITMDCTDVPAKTALA